MIISYLSLSSFSSLAHVLHTFLLKTLQLSFPIATLLPSHTHSHTSTLSLSHTHTLYLYLSLTPYLLLTLYLSQSLSLSLGVFEFDAFAKGTFGIASTLAELTSKGCITIIGGGGENTFKIIIIIYIIALLMLTTLKTHILVLKLSLINSCFLSLRNAFSLYLFS